MNTAVQTKKMLTRTCTAQQHCMAFEPCTGRPQRPVLDGGAGEGAVAETGSPTTVATTNGSSSVSVSVSTARVFMNSFLSLSSMRSSTTVEAALGAIKTGA